MRLKKLVPSLPLLVIVAVPAAFAACLALAWSVPPTDYDPLALRTFESLGFTEAKVVARHPGITDAWQHGCGENDETALELRAKDPIGRTRDVIVCCGIHVRGIKGEGCSIRP